MREFSDNDFILGMQSGYREAMEFTDCHCDNPELQDADFSDELLKQADKDCEAFFHENKKLLRESGLHPDQCGHDFWLTRNGHGAGFWDRGLADTGQVVLGFHATAYQHNYGAHNHEHQAQAPQAFLVPVLRTAFAASYTRYHKAAPFQTPHFLN